MRCLLGIDPGLSGAAAILEVDNGVNPRIRDAINLPVIGVGAGARIDALALSQWITLHKPDHVFVERSQPMPRQGISSTFRYARATGMIEAVITVLKIPMTTIPPASWKRFHHLGSDKEQSRQRVLELFPASHALFARKCDHQRSEAVLIALFGGHQYDHPHARIPSPRCSPDQSSAQARTRSSTSLGQDACRRAVARHLRSALPCMDAVTRRRTRSQRSRGVRHRAPEHRGRKQRSAPRHPPVLSPSLQ